MEAFCLEIFQAFLLVLASSVDAFAAGFSYGAQRVRIPPISLLAIAVICSGTLAGSLWLGEIFVPVMSESIAKKIGVLLLLLMGVSKFFDRMFKRWIQNLSPKKEFCFSVFHLRCILTIYADPVQADADASRRLSLKEAIALSVALSVDGLAAGVGAGMTDVSGSMGFIMALGMSLLAVWCGQGIGRRFCRLQKIDSAFISAGVLILLAGIKAMNI